MSDNALINNSFILKLQDLQFKLALAFTVQYYNSSECNIIFYFIFYHFLNHQQLFILDEYARSVGNGPCSRCSCKSRILVVYLLNSSFG